jgi:hypothetical protein
MARSATLVTLQPTWHLLRALCAGLDLAVVEMRAETVDLRA